MLTRTYRPSYDDFSTPVRALGDLRREIDRVFADFDRFVGGADPGFRDTAVGPRASLHDEGEALVLRAELPGFREQDLEVALDRDTLTVRGARQVEPPAGFEPRHRERHAVRFTRTFTLPARVDAASVEASLREGVLTLTLPKAPEERPRKVEIRAS